MTDAITTTLSDQLTAATMAVRGRTRWQRLTGRGLDGPIHDVIRALSAALPHLDEQLAQIQHGASGPPWVCDRCGRSSEDWLNDLAAPVVYFVDPNRCVRCAVEEDRERLARVCEVLRRVCGGYDEHHDTLLLRPPAAPSPGDGQQVYRRTVLALAQQLMAITRGDFRPWPGEPNPPTEET